MSYTILYEVGLQTNMESLNVSYPEGFLEQDKSEGLDEEGFTLSPGLNSYRTEAEIELAKIEIRSKNYRQKLIYTGSVRVLGQEPLLNFQQVELDKVESALKYPNSRYLKSGGERTLAERISQIRERGYTGDGTDLGSVTVTVTPLVLETVNVAVTATDLLFV